MVQMIKIKYVVYLPKKKKKKTISNYVHGFQTWVVPKTSKGERIKAFKVRPKLNCDDVIINLVIN